MARRRFSDVLRGNILNQQLQAYRQWQDRPMESRGQGIGQRAGQLQRVDGLISPFGLDLDAGESIKVIASQRSVNNSTLRGAITNTRLNTSPSATQMENALPMPAGFRPAKVVFFQSGGGGTTATSNITRARYYRRSGNSYTLPFGAKTQTEKEGSACLEIAGMLRTGFNLVSFQPEKAV